MLRYSSCPTPRGTSHRSSSGGWPSFWSRWRPGRWRWGGHSNAGQCHGMLWHCYDTAMSAMNALFTKCLLRSNRFPFSRELLMAQQQFLSVSKIRGVFAFEVSTYIKLPCQSCIYPCDSIYDDVTSMSSFITFLSPRLWCAQEPTRVPMAGISQRPVMVLKCCCARRCRLPLGSLWFFDSAKG